MRTAKNWASRPHCPPGSNMGVNIHKANAMGAIMEKPEQKTHVDLGGRATGKVHAPGWFSTKK